MISGQHATLNLSSGRIGMGNNRFEARYQSGDTPWDHGMVDFNLTEVVARHAVRPCRALDIGCGTGDNAIWLAHQGFDVVACDLSKTAIERAQLKAEEAQAGVSFLTADFLNDSIPAMLYGFVFDRGCLHCMPEASDRKVFAEKVSELLEEKGIWLSLVGNADEGEREVGPPQLSASELASIVEPRFEILSLCAGQFGSDQESPPRAWVCLMRKRQD